MTAPPPTVGHTRLVNCVTDAWHRVPGSLQEAPGTRVTATVQGHQNSNFPVGGSPSGVSTSCNTTSASAAMALLGPNPNPGTSPTSSLRQHNPLTGWCQGWNGVCN